MTEEVKQEVVVQKEPEYTPVQVKAMEQGWRPKEEFEGAEDEFIDAPEFVRRGELFSKIENQSKELKAVKRALDQLQQGQTKIREQEYDRALKSLQIARRQAFVEGENDKAFAIEDQIENVKAEKQRIVQEAQQSVVPEVNPEFTAWTNNNPWYSKDRAMQAAADAIGLDYAKQGYTPAQVLKKVEEDIRKEFPHKFTNVKATRPSPVEGTSRSSPSRGTEVDLTDIERQIMNKLVSRGDMTETEYKKQIKEQRGK